MVGWGEEVAHGPGNSSRLIRYGTRWKGGEGHWRDEAICVFDIHEPPLAAIVLRLGTQQMGPALEGNCFGQGDMTI